MVNFFVYLYIMITKKQYRNILNEQDKAARVQAVNSNSKFRPTKRLYGDYLYSQDREMFDVQYKEYIQSL